MIDFQGHDDAELRVIRDGLDSVLSRQPACAVAAADQVAASMRDLSDDDLVGVAQVALTSGDTSTAGTVLLALIALEAGRREEAIG